MKPILFNTEMVRAILDGRKTVTRRVIKAGAHKILRGGTFPGAVDWSLKVAAELDNHGVVVAPYQPGDILYVRQTWCKVPGVPPYVYRATCHDGIERKWRPSIHMPKEAARIFLRVTNVRVERLQDMTDDDAKTEGANWENSKHVGISEKMRRSALERFTEIWDSTIKKSDLDLYGWDANPWVWVIEFERCEKPKGE